MIIQKNDDCMTVRLTGDIDHHTAKNIRETVDNEITQHRPKSLVLDFSDVPFMDSSGIGLVMGRYKLIAPSGGKMTIKGTTRHTKRVMIMAGLDKLANIL